MRGGRRRKRLSLSNQEVDSKSRNGLVALIIAGLLVVKKKRRGGPGGGESLKKK